MDAARASDLLFADVAVALGAAEPPRLARAIEAFWARPSGALAEALVREGVLDATARAAVEKEVLRIVAEAGGDPVAAVARRGGVDGTLHQSFSPGAVAGVPSRAPLRTVPPGRYKDFTVVGKGGMGLVYLALDTEMNRRVAFKMVKPDPAAGKDAAAPETPLDATPPSRAEESSRAFEELTVRFLQEAWVTGGMEHPGVVPVYELGRTDAGIPYYTMRYVRGERTLATAIKETQQVADLAQDARSEGHVPLLPHLAVLGQADLDARLALLEPFLKVCDTIAYAHAKGIVHRDLKPENIALGEFGEAVVLDWGLAKTRGRPDLASAAWHERVEELRAVADLRTVAGAMGTAGYMAPEAALGRTEEVDERSDVYSLGAILFEILVGRLPFRFRNFVEYVQRILEEDAPQAHEVEPAVPEELGRACAKALARKPEDRFASAGELAQAVRRWEREGRVEQQASELLDHARAEVEAARRGTGNTVLWHLDRASAACSKILHLRGGHADATALVAEIKQLRDRGIRERVHATRRRAVIGAGFLVLLAASILSIYVAQRLADARTEAEARVHDARADARARESEARTAFDDAAAARAARADLYASVSASLLRRNDAAGARIAAARSLVVAQAPAGYAALAAAEAGYAPTLHALFEAPGAGAVAFGRDGRLYIAAGTRVMVREGGRGGTTSFDAGERARLLAVSPDGDRIAVAGATTRVFRTRDGSLVAVLPDPEGTPPDEVAIVADAGAPTALAFDAGGDRLVVGHESGALADWDVPERSLRGMRARGARVTALAWDGEFLLVGDADGNVARLEEGRFDLPDTRPYGSAPVSQILAGGDGVVYASTLDHRLGMGEFDVEVEAGISGSFRVLTEFEAPAGRATAFLFAPDRARLFAAKAGGVVSVWSAETRREIARLLPEGPEVTGFSLSPNGALLAVATADDVVRVFALDMRWPPEGHEPSSATASANARTYYARPDLALEAWDDFADKRLARTRAGATTATVSAIAVSGERLYVATLDGTLGVWSLALEPKASLRTPVATALAAGAGQDEVVLGLLDGTVELWSVGNRRKITSLEGEEGLPVAGLRVADGRIDAWDVAGGHRSWDAATRAPSPARTPTPMPAGAAHAWVTRDPTARLIDFENRYGRKLAGAEVVPVPPGEYDPARPPIDPWSR